MRKGQMVIVDVLVAASIFIGLIIVVTLAYNNFSYYLEQKINYNKIQYKAFQTADSLVKSRGSPLAWELDLENIEKLGLATMDRELSSSKVDAFVNMDKDKIRRLLKIDSYGYNFYFAVLNDEGLVLEQKGDEPEPSSDAVNLRRVVVYEEKASIMEFTLWK